ncbi:macrolide family glycosyltransferase [Moorena sp. SIO3I6]|uniref:macrolide family glycosyltransferase n=1 Tax=Moorena sp. SIO3I6 TaxID=2607831 RepID=UPI0013F83A56|nr:macrolide family glycosyltransferase [Moorena sp. SIO3I6]NEP21584.1 hypothetical protein [Moorena sp. SIO3I6]
MSNIVFFDLPIYSRMATTVGITNELAQRGEEIACYCFEELRDLIESHGARFCNLPKMKEAPEDVTLQSRVIEYTLDAVPILLAQLERDRPKLLIFTSKCLWGAVLGDLLNLSTVCIHTNFLLPPSFFPPIQLLLEAYPIAETPRHLRLFNRDRQLWRQLIQKYPLKRIEERDVFKLQPNCMNLRGDLNIVYASEMFQIQRSKFNKNYHFTGPCYIDRPLEPELPLKTIQNNSIIYISLGSVKFYNTKYPFYEKCLQAFKDSDRTIVMAVGEMVDVESLGQIPSNFIVRNYVPQLSILQHASVFITHGGTNSTWEAIINQVPMIVFPQGGDQYLVANRVEELRLGRWVKQKSIQPREFKKIVEQVIEDNEIRDSIKRLSKSFREAGGIQKAVDIILEYKK